jgi:hypothetical protein
MTREQIMEILNSNDEYFKDDSSPALFPYKYSKVADAILALPLDVPSDEEIWKWWKEQKFQRVRGEQEYIMIYEIDLPKILKSFTEHFLNGCETK